MSLRDTDVGRGHRRGGGRTGVRLNAAALWRRLSLLGRSQNWLAREIGISPGYMSMLANGERSPSGRICRRMQKALGVTNYQELCDMEDSNEQH